MLKTIYLVLEAWNPYPASVNEGIGLCEKDRWLVDQASNDQLAVQQSHCQCLLLIVLKFYDCHDSDTKPFCHHCWEIYK